MSKEETKLEEYRSGNLYYVWCKEHKHGMSSDKQNVIKRWLRLHKKHHPEAKRSKIESRC